MAEFLCASCGKNYFQKAALQKHHYQVHKQEICACNECGKILTSKKQLANHVSSHNKIKCRGCEKTIPKNSKSCPDCGETETLNCCTELYILHISLVFTFIPCINCVRHNRSQFDKTHIGKRSVPGLYLVPELGYPCH